MAVRAAVESLQGGIRGRLDIRRISAIRFVAFQQRR